MEDRNDRMGVSVLDIHRDGRWWVRVRDKRYNGGKAKVLGGFGRGPEAKAEAQRVADEGRRLAGGDDDREKGRIIHRR